MKLWSIGVLAFSLTVGAAGLVTACSDSNPGTPQGGDGGASGCPTNPPSNGSACFLANNATCNYNAAQIPNCECCGAGGTTYICSNGKWEEEATSAGGAAGAGAAPACPVTVPEAGSACTSYYGGCGAPAQQLCSYSCAQGGSQEATCNGSEWTITTSGDCSDDGGDAGDGGDASDGG